MPALTQRLTFQFSSSFRGMQFPQLWFQGSLVVKNIVQACRTARGVTKKHYPALTLEEHDLSCISQKYPAWIRIESAGLSSQTLVGSDSSLHYVNIIMQRVILLVEDEEINVLLFRKAMQALQMQERLVRLQNGREALEYFQGTKAFSDRNAFPLPDLILLDQNLPYRQGLDILKWIREHTVFKTMVVVMFTSCENPRTIRRAYDLGANAYVVKPGDPQKLIGLLQALRNFWLCHNHSVSC